MKNPCTQIRLKGIDYDFDPYTKEGEKYFFGSRQSGKSTRAVKKFVEHYPNVIMVRPWEGTRWQNDILDMIIKIGKYPEWKKTEISKRLLPAGNLRERLKGFRNAYKIWDEVMMSPETNYPVDHIYQVFDYVTSSDGEFIKEYMKCIKLETLKAIEEL